MSLEKLKAELERALEQLGTPPECASPRGDSARGNPAAASTERPPRTSAAAASKRGRASQLPGRTLVPSPQRALSVQRTGRGEAGGCGHPVEAWDGDDPPHPDCEEWDLSTTGAGSSTVSPALSPRGSARPSSEASDPPMSSCAGGWPTTPPPSRGWATPSSEGDCQHAPGQSWDLTSVTSLASGSTRARSTSSLAGSSSGAEGGEGSGACGGSSGAVAAAAAPPPVKAHAMRGKFGWALGGSLGPCRSDLLRSGGDQRSLHGCFEVACAEASLFGGGSAASAAGCTGGDGAPGAAEAVSPECVRRRSVLADLAGCLYRIDEDAMPSWRPLPRLLPREVCRR